MRLMAQDNGNHVRISVDLMFVASSIPVWVGHPSLCQDDAEDAEDGEFSEARALRD